MENCIFCKIINGEISSPKLYEDDDCIIIKDINPKARLHYLLIPKKHYALIEEQTAEDAVILGRIINKLNDLKSILGLENGYRLQINQGENGGQEVPHLHIHILVK